MVRNLLVLWCLDGSTLDHTTVETTSDATGDDLIGVAYDLVAATLDEDVRDALAVDHVVELPAGTLFTVTHREL